MITIRPFKYRPIISPTQRQKPFPENCVCDIYIFYYKCFGRYTTVLIPSERVHDIAKQYVSQYAVDRLGDCMYKDEHGWYLYRPVSELINDGVFDITGEFVEIPLGKYVKVNDKPCDRITRFCMMTKDDDGNVVYIDGCSPSEIRARFVNRYPECEP